MLNLGIPSGFLRMSSQPHVDHRISPFPFLLFIHHKGYSLSGLSEFSSSIPWTFG